MTRRKVIAAIPAMVASAQDILEKTPPKADARIPYGTDPLQFGDLRLPTGKGPHPVAINIHGGYWRAAYDLEHNGHLCEALRKKGVATWSIEYRRIGNPGGAWPGTLDDAKAAANFLGKLRKKHRLNLKRVIAMGHSAGGQLALYLGAELPWLTGVISLAGVADLRRALELKLSREVVKDFLGGTPEEVPERYKSASPMERLPLKMPTVLLHGDQDTIVPLEILPSTGHFDLIDPSKPQWAAVERNVLEMLHIS